MAERIELGEIGERPEEQQPEDQQEETNVDTGWRQGRNCWGGVGGCDTPPKVEKRCCCRAVCQFAGQYFTWTIFTNICYPSRKIYLMTNTS